jgi:hypothetical protein
MATSIAPRWAGAGVKFNLAAARAALPCRCGKWRPNGCSAFAADGSLRSAEAFDALPRFSSSRPARITASRRCPKMAPAAGAAGERYAMQKIELKKGDWPIGPVRTH